jgi:hypothetical protein
MPVPFYFQSQIPAPGIESGHPEKEWCDDPTEKSALVHRSAGRFHVRNKRP